MIYFVRHAYSLYNQAEKHIEEELGQHYIDHATYLKAKFDWKYLDVEITQEGIQQCHKLRQYIKNQQFDVILVSPMRRALHTCSIAFQDHIGKTQIIVEPAFRQIMQSSNDIGAFLSESRLKYPHFNFNKISDDEAWYIQTLHDEKDRAEINAKLQVAKGEQRKKIAVEQCLRVMKQNWQQRRKNPAQDQQLKLRILPSYEQQTKVIKNYLAKNKKIAIVAHSECIKRYAGYKIKNCQVFPYEFKEQ